MDNFAAASASFGPFRLDPAARRVEKDGVPFPLTSRALDILIVLVENASEIVAHRELIARVWRGLEVTPGSLRTHMASLRKALGDGEDGARYIANVAGQGYCFVAPVLRSQPAERAPAPARASAREGGFRMRALPPLLARMVGRDEATRAIADDLLSHRFLTIVGPGGMGKTTVAVAVAHALRESFADAVCFVDLGTLSNPQHVASTVASTLGLTVQAEDALPELRESLRRARMLLVLDNCEHVIEAAATLSEAIFREAPGVHVLATSREALRVDGECTYLLPPLAYPPLGIPLDAAAAQAFPAVRLFTECVAAAGARFELSDADAPIVASICSRLDGIALAIEFAAGRVGAYGIDGIDGLLNSRFGLEWPGRRTAPQRHQTLNATLDWSHDLLSDSERAVLRRLSIFVGTFTLEAAQAVACAGAIDSDRVVIDVGELVTKSVVSAAAADDRTVRYRLMETTRAYALEKLEGSGELDATVARHAAYFTRLFDAASGGGIDPHRDDLGLALAEHLGNVRAALDGCLGEPARHTALGVDLAAAAAPVLMQLLLFNEAHRWSTAALSMLDDADRGTAKEMVLQETLAIASMWTRSNGKDLRNAITRGLEIANGLAQAAPRLRWMVGMHIYLLRIGDFYGTRDVAEALGALARSSDDVSYKVMADWLRGSSAHFIGDQQAARQYFQEGFERPGPRNLQLFGLDYRVRALVTFSRVLWLSGCPDRAMDVARQAISEAETFGRPLDVCFTLLYPTSVFLWCGDWDSARRSLTRLTQHANWPALPSFHSTGQALEGELLLNTGEMERGIAMLRAALQSMRDQRQLLFFMRAASALASGLIRQAQPAEALAVVDEAIADTEGGAEGTEFAELLRLRAEALMRLPGTDAARVDEALVRSLDCARRQNARSLELRTATTLARHRANQGRRDEAHRGLAAAHRAFTEGFGTQDLQAAERLLKELAPAADAAGHARRVRKTRALPASPADPAP